MLTYERLLATLRGGGHADVSVGQPASTAAIAAAESGLGVVFPPQYRRFLETLGHLDVAPCEVFGVGAEDEPAVVAQSREWRGSHGVPDRAVIVEVDGLEGDPVGFVADEAAPGAEPPIWRWERGRAVQIAVSFADYLAGIAEGIVREQVDASASPVFDPPWGQRRAGGAVVPDRKEIKAAGMFVQRVKYDGVSFSALVKELNARRIPARGLPGWTIDAAREVYDAWKDRY